MKILNLTQHPSSPKQREEGVYDAKNINKLKNLLTFTDLPDPEIIERRVDQLINFILEQDVSPDAIMIGGAPFLMHALHQKLIWMDIPVFYAFSKRESVEKIVDGKVIKTSKFLHKGFIKYFP